ncbi:MAG: mechanosensitive ion channel [Bryobacterales bacterium]|nr:mechanosensitive ion channel [Bryobacterales bacterium]
MKRNFWTAALVVCSLFGQTEEGAVMLDGKEVFRVETSSGTYGPKERAVMISERLKRAAESSEQGVHIVELPDSSELRLGNIRLHGVRAADAAAAGIDRQQLAQRWAKNIDEAIKAYREARDFGRLVRGVALALLTTVLIAIVQIGLWRLRKWAVSRTLRASQARRTRNQNEEDLFSALRVGEALATVQNLFFWAITLLLAEVYVPILLAFFPGTSGWANKLFDLIKAPLLRVSSGLVDFLPNALNLLVIAGITLYSLRMTRVFFQEIGEEKVRLKGFHADWAEPTYRLVRLAVLMLALVMAYPYVPGSNSEAFKGLSIFVGVLLSLGSSSAMANGVAGTIITYMRGYKVGDFIQIGDDMGEVVEQTLLVTRIRTIKNVIITIPNGNVLSAHVVNYSTGGSGRPLILHTGITIGYDAPWQVIHQLMVDAALATEGVLREPRPFVLQTSLNDFHVSYEINAYTLDARKMPEIYSALHQNIQDKFNEAGVEIMSPHYTALRDGNTVTIPENHRPSDYEPAAFRVSNGSHGR